MLSQNKLIIEPLEDRLLLSGNVFATLIGDALFIEGDAEANSLQIALSENSVELVGTNNTTINESSETSVFEFASDRPLSLFAFLRSGDDEISIQGPSSNVQNVLVFAGQGDDRLGLSNFTTERILIVAGAGNDQLAAQDINTNRFVISSGAGDDTIAIEQLDSERVVLVTGSGADDVILQNSNLQSLRMNTGRGNDRALLQNNSIDSRTNIRLGAGDDFTSMEDNQVEDVFIFGKLGNDSISAESNSVVFGGAGLDSSNAFKTFGVESDSVDATLVESKINDPQTGMLARASAAQQINGPTELTLQLQVQDATTSNGTLIIQREDRQTPTSEPRSTVIEGLTRPGATVELDSDGDAQFDDGTVVADADGNFQIVANLFHDDANLGANELAVRTRDGNDELTQEFSVHFAVGTVTRFKTPLGSFDIELLDEDAAITVDNFLGYFGRFENSFVHRSPSGFVIQGGSFVFENEAVSRIQTDLPIQGEFTSENSNLRGTLSMALTANSQGTDPNSGTSGWFINVADNTNLDNAGHTVFGRVIGTGMEIVDQINQLPALNLTDVTNNFALAETPIQNQTPISGTASLAFNTTLVNGTGTSFLQEVSAGDSISFGGQSFTVSQVTSDTQLTVDQPLTSTPSGISGQSIFIVSPPQATDIVFTELSIVEPDLSVSRPITV